MKVTLPSVSRPRLSESSSQGTHVRKLIEWSGQALCTEKTPQSGSAYTVGIDLLISSMIMVAAKQRKRYFRVPPYAIHKVAEQDSFHSLALLCNRDVLTRQLHGTTGTISWRGRATLRRYAMHSIAFVELAVREAREPALIAFSANQFPG